MSKPPFVNVTLSLGDMDFLRDIVDFLEDILEHDVDDEEECNDTDH